MINHVKCIFVAAVILVASIVFLCIITDNLHIRRKRQSIYNYTEELILGADDEKVTFEDIIAKNKKFSTLGKDLLVLLHIQKTGGTTFEKHLVQDLKLKPSCICEGDKRRCSCPRTDAVSSDKTFVDSTWLISRFSTGWVCGLHPDWTQLTNCLWGLRRLFFMTFLRNPVHRFISEFRHVQRGATWKTSKTHCPAYNTQLCYAGSSNWSNVSLEEFLTCPHNMAINRQTRMLADHKYMSCPSSNDVSTHNQNLMLLSAMNNLKNMGFFGLCEQQRASQLIFERTFGLEFKENFRQSEDNKTKMLIESLPYETLQSIIKFNYLDVKLYNYAVNLFHQRCTYLFNDCTQILPATKVLSPSSLLDIN